MIESVSYNYIDSILTVTPTGLVDNRQQVYSFVDQFTQKAIENFTTKILIDEQNLIVTVNSFEVVTIINRLNTSCHRQKGFRIAAINSTELGISFIADMLAEIKMIQYKHFPTETEAKWWLHNK